MTSIAAASNSNYLSPLQQLQAELQAEVNSGAISSSDQPALSSALTDINSSLQGGGASTGGASSPPGDLKAKIDSLIAGEVSSGKLTSAQATELQGVFKAAFANGPGGSAGANATLSVGGATQAAGTPAAGGTHHGHHGHHGGSSVSDTSSSTGSTGGSSDPNSASDILQQFLKTLQASLSQVSSYGASGSSDSGNAGTTSVSALLIDYQT